MIEPIITSKNTPTNVQVKTEHIKSIWFQHKHILDKYIDNVHWTNNDDFYEQLAPIAALLEDSVRKMEALIGDKKLNLADEISLITIENVLNKKTEIGYSKHKNLSETIIKFGLTYQKNNLFKNFIQDGTIQAVAMTEARQNTLNEGLELALPTGSEMARMSLIVMPILLELRNINHKEVVVYVSESLNADSSKDLNGECDFIIAATTITDFVDAPIITLVEGKKNSLGDGLAQCIAQMVGAQLFNQQKKEDIEVMYGCVTTGTEWQFMKLENKVLTLDSQIYYLKELEVLLGIFQYIIEPYLPNK